jgi:hypothetical protein
MMDRVNEYKWIEKECVENCGKRIVKNCNFEE